MSTRRREPAGNKPGEGGGPSGGRKPRRASGKSPAGIERREEKLQEVRGLFDTLAAGMPDGLVVLDQDGSVLFANRAAYRITGLRQRRNPSSLTVVDFIHPGDLERAMRDHVAALEGRAWGLSQYRILTPRGGTRWIETIGQKVSFRGRTANLVTFRDITKRRQTEEALRVSEERLRLSEKKFAEAFHSSPFAVSISEPATGRIVDVNGAYEMLSGFSRRELVGHGTVNLGLWVEPEDRGRYLGLLGTHKRITGFETRLRRKDGSLRDVVLSASTIELGGVSHIQTIVHDISAQKTMEAALKESEDRYRRITSAVTDYIYTVHLEEGDAVRTVHSPACESVTGYTPEEFEKDRFLWYAMVEEEDRELVREHFNRVTTGERLHPIEHRIRRKDGTIRWVSNMPVIHRDSLGNMVSYDGVVSDITERKLAEAELRESEERFRVLHDASFGGIGIHDRGIILDCNQGLSDLTGYTSEELIGMNGLELIAPSWRDQVMQKITSGYDLPYDVEGLHKDGTVYPLEIRGRNIPYHGRMARVTEFRDITQRMETERQTRERQARLDSIFRVAPVGIGVVVDRVLQEVNDRVCEMTGYAREELTGRPARILYPTQEDSDYVGAEKYRQIREQGTGSVETRWMRKDGTIIHIILSSTPIDPENHAAGVTFTALDITERIRNEDALRESEERYRLMAELTGKLVYDHDIPSGRMTWHGAVSQITGFLPEDFAAVDMKAWNGMIHPEDRGSTIMAFEEALQGCGSYQAEYRICRKDGACIFVEDHGVFLPDASGSACRMLGSIGDISGRRRADEALKQKTDQLDSFFNIALDLLCIADTQGRFHMLNRAWEKTLGYTREELMQGRFFDHIHPDDVKSTEDTVARLASGQAVINFINRYRCRDGSYRWIEWRSASAGTMIYAAARDITERRQAEEALRESEARYHSLFDNSHAVMLLVEPETGRIVDANPAACEYYGYSHQEITSRKIMEINTLTQDEVFAEMEQARSRRKRSFIFRHRLAGGEVRDVEVFSGPIMVEGRTLLYSIVHDITDRRRAEDALRESEERFRSLIQNAADIIVILDRNGCFSYESPSLSHILGYPPGQLLGRTPLEFIHPEDQDLVARELRDVYQGSNEGLPTEFRFRKADGSWIHLEAIGSGLLDFPGINGVVITARDITERKKAEELRLEMERRLLHAQRLESLGVMAGGIAHDFNNLLMAILGNLDLAQMDLSPVSRSGPFIDHALMAARRAADLTNQMLAYSGKGRFDLKTFDLSELVDEMSHLLKASISKTVTLNLQTVRNLPHIKADPGQIQQIIMNLIVNASEAIGDAAGVVTIMTGYMDCSEDDLARSRLKEKPLPGHYIFFEVGDTGCGMDGETMDRLFDPFFTTKFTGRGLGLAAVSGIVAGHRGAIMVESQPGRGSTIRVLLPVSHDQPRSAAHAGDKEGRLSAAGRRQGLPGGTVLVVDDEEMVRDLCRSMVERLGFSVLTASDGEEAVRVFREHAPEIVCVILDLTMPRKDGMETLNELKHMDAEVRVVLSSGFNEQETTQRFLGRGLAGFIKKPYRLESLRRELERVLGNT